MKKLILVLASACTLLTCCELPSAETETPSRVEVGPHQKRDQKKEKSPKKEPQDEAVHAKSANIGISSFRPIYYLKDVGAQGRTVSTADETVWAISYGSTYITQFWQPGSPLIIQPNTSLFATSDYYLYNTLTNEHAEADLSQGPFLKYSVLITQINYYNGYVQLSNGTEWLVSQSQLSTINSLWQLNQAVLIGENTSWFGPKYILVNINENNYATADLLH
jgi:hypothetical protein